MRKWTVRSDAYGLLPFFLIMVGALSPSYHSFHVIHRPGVSPTLEIFGGVVLEGQLTNVDLK